MFRRRMGLSSIVCLVVMSISTGVLAEGGATGACMGAAPAGERGFPAGGDRIALDRIVIKLTEAAARDADSLPEERLPQGIHAFDQWLARHGLRDGYRMVRSHGVAVRDQELFTRIGLDRSYVLRLPESDPEAVRSLLAELMSQEWIEFAEASAQGEFLRTPDDPLFPDQWVHENTGQNGGTPGADIDTPPAWDTQTGSPSTIIAIIDSGVDLVHEDLMANIVPGYDFGEDDTDPQDKNGHGTGVAGAAAARGNNGIGISGTCWSCGIMPLKVRKDDYVLTEWVADAIRYAADNGARVINLSLGWQTWQQGLSDAIDYATGRGVIVVAAIGNAKEGSALLPAAFPKVLAVGGRDKDDRRAGSFGDHMDVCAAASDVLTTRLDGGYESFGGTSVASPLVAGAAGLLISQDPDLHAREVRYLLRLGADDEVGSPAEDVPGWDRYDGYGRLNVDGSMGLIDGPWLALDKAHYLCTGDLVVALKDRNATGSVTVTLTGSAGGDSETVTMELLTGSGYFEGTVPISWAGKDGPVQVENGVFDLQDGETITARYGTLTAEAFGECALKVCRGEQYRMRFEGDCDGDHAADPGELIGLLLPVASDYTMWLESYPMTITTSSPDVDLLRGTATYGRLRHRSLFPKYSLANQDGTDDSFLFRVHAGAAANSEIAFSLSPPEGPGWESDVAACDLSGWGSAFTIPVNRELDSEVVHWDFDDGTAQGFTHGVSHGSGELSECSVFFPWLDEWSSSPVTDRAHSGSYSMRVGDGTSYSERGDGALVTPSFTVPSEGGAMTFWLWAETEVIPYYWGETLFAKDGMVVEARPASSGGPWKALQEGSYNVDQDQEYCMDFWAIPFGSEEIVDLFAGDGEGEELFGDTFDHAQEVSLNAFSGQEINLRFRFGSNNYEGTEGRGLWVDTIQVRSYSADGWAGAAPEDLVGSTAHCPDGYELSWSPVAGSDGYSIYRSSQSCAQAQASRTIYGSSATELFQDPFGHSDTGFFYAVEARESGSGCPTERSCITGSCSCIDPQDPAGLTLTKGTEDLYLSWDDPGNPELTWNLYRDENPDPSLWGGPHAEDLVDEDASKPGVQHTDPGAASDGLTWFYLVTAESSCGESSLR